MLVDLPDPQQQVTPLPSPLSYTRNNHSSRQRFSSLIQQAAAAELFSWRTTATGRLAEIIVLDQFSRNAYRDTPRAFAQDPMALALAQEAVASGALQSLNQKQRGFLLLPYMHSESRQIHVVAQRSIRILPRQKAITTNSDTKPSLIILAATRTEIKFWDEFPRRKNKRF